MPRKAASTAPSTRRNPACAGFSPEGCGGRSGSLPIGRIAWLTTRNTSTGASERNGAPYMPMRRPALPQPQESPMKALLPRLALPAFLAMALLLAACQGMAPMQQKSLYERLGGKDAITAVVDDFVANVAADNRINKFFVKTNIPNLKRNLVDQICQATGGPCTYTGRDMKTAHKGMGVTDADFNALVEDLQKSLNKFKVPDKEQGELLSILGSLKPQIVGQ